MITTVIDAKDRVYFRDVYDHLVRLHDISESLRDLVGGVLDTYLSVINNRMNEIMKTLTHDHHCVHANFVRSRIFWDEFLPADR